MIEIKPRKFLLRKIKINAKNRNFDRITGSFNSMTPTIKCFGRGMQKFLALLLYFKVAQPHSRKK